MSRTVPFAERHRGEEAQAEPEQFVILGPDGQPARLSKTARCPQCGAGPDQRVPSSGFGIPHDLCQACGYDLE